MNLLFSYDYAGYEQALEDALRGDVIEDLQWVINYCGHDLEKGFCQSFQVYTENGSLIYDSNQRGIMKGKVTIILHPEEIINAFTAQEFMKMYGAKNLLSELYMDEIMNNLDIDEVLEFIGDEKIAEYYEKYIQKKDIA